MTSCSCVSVIIRAAILCLCVWHCCFWWIQTKGCRMVIYFQNCNMLRLKFLLSCLCYVLSLPTHTHKFSFFIQTKPLWLSAIVSERVLAYLFPSSARPQVPPLCSELCAWTCQNIYLSRCSGNVSVYLHFASLDVEVVNCGPLTGGFSINDCWMNEYSGRKKRRTIGRKMELV